MRVVIDLAALIRELVDAVAHASHVIQMLTRDPRYPVLTLGASFKREGEHRVVINSQLMDACSFHPRVPRWSKGRE